MATGSDVERRSQQLRELTAVSRALTYARVLDDVLSLTVDHAAALLEADKVVLMLADDDGLLSVRASRGLEPSACDGFLESPPEALLDRVRAILSTDDEDRFLGVPLVVGGDVMGLLAVARPAGDRDPEGDEWLLSALADQAAVALEKSRLDETAAFRERLLGIVGHDLRNPLQAIMMGADYLLTKGSIGAPEMTAVRRIAGSAARMAHMIDQLVDFTRARLGGGIVLDRQATDLIAVCAQVVDELAVANPAAVLRFSPDPAPDGMWDRQRLAQVFSNLVMNALQHGAPGAPIDVRCRHVGDQVTVEVGNQGPPIPAELLPRLFDPFRQGQGRAGRSATSMGLGLYIAEQIVRAHDGRIEVVSTVERGTTFTVTLPLDAAGRSRRSV